MAAGLKPELTQQACTSDLTWNKFLTTLINAGQETVWFPDREANLIRKPSLYDTARLLRHARGPRKGCEEEKRHHEAEGVADEAGRSVAEVRAAARLEPSPPSQGPTQGPASPDGDGSAHYAACAADVVSFARTFNSNTACDAQPTS